jgi:hypothetical protein
MHDPLKQLLLNYLYLFLLAIFGWLFAKHFLKYVIAAFVTTWKYRLSSNQLPESVEYYTLPPSVATDIQCAAPQLAALGFAALAYVKSPPPVGKVEHYSHLWTNRLSSDIAAVSSTLRMRKGKWVKGGSGVTFIRRSLDDFVIATSSVGLAGILPRKPSVDYVTLPGVMHLATLFGVHQARCQRRPELKWAPLPEDAIAYVREQQRKSHEYWAERGFFRLDSRNHNCRLTFKGAYRITSRLLWPLKQKRATEQKRKADAMLKELGFGDLKTLVGSQPSPAVATSIGPPPLPPPLPQSLSVSENPPLPG